MVSKFVRYPNKAPRGELPLQHPDKTPFTVGWAGPEGAVGERETQRIQRAGDRREAPGFRPGRSQLARVSCLMSKQQQTTHLNNHHTGQVRSFQRDEMENHRGIGRMWDCHREEEEDRADKAPDAFH
ncbi:unnamed protein product [Pleuronectes platessa]|uniref:Uncharacterized protein n=1 Tax=Pleuronectes platessa TaxID=8262 RepID=A0A9N7YTK9_PLEPL|nr:unnamed protein product [Pleuronectes platessa]